MVAAGIGALLVWFTWALFPFLAPRVGVGWNSETLGQWGDAFGALNALFSALAFISVLFTLKQQQRQIDDATNDQHLQRFERTFYELLRLLREARDAVEFRYSDNYDGGERKKEKDYEFKVTGAEAFKRAQFEVKYWVEAEEIHVGPLTEARVSEIYIQHVHNRYESAFAPYYRLLYTILLRIKSDQKLSVEEKQRYGNLLRSQLTSHEVALCSYNGLAAVSGSFKQLLIEFRILKYLPADFGRKIFQAYYPATAFLGRDIPGSAAKISTYASEFSVSRNIPVSFLRRSLTDATSSILIRSK
ncbi:putative phage abortive infection protein [Sinorhizobium meliloti]|nr:putative phage abortive infection protein [Sinorhizobium meliloti]